MILFIYFWLRWVLGVASGGYSSLRCVGFSLQWLLLQITGCRAWTQSLWYVGLVSPQNVGSNPCIGRWILNPCNMSPSGS